MGIKVDWKPTASTDRMFNQSLRMMNRTPIHEVAPHECYRPSRKHRAVVWIREFWWCIVLGVALGTLAAQITIRAMEGFLG